MKVDEPNLSVSEPPKITPKSPKEKFIHTSRSIVREKWISNSILNSCLPDSQLCKIARDLGYDFQNHSKLLDLQKLTQKQLDSFIFVGENIHTDFQRAFEDFDKYLDVCKALRKPINFQKIESGDELQKNYFESQNYS